MNTLIIFLIGLGVGGLMVYFLVFKNSDKEGGLAQKSKSVETGEGLIEKQAREKAENKKKILEIFTRKERVANNDVQSLLSVSDATATRYLQELEDEGLIRQVGKTGQPVYYERLK